MKMRSQEQGQAAQRNRFDLPRGRVWGVLIAITLCSLVQGCDKTESFVVPLEYRPTDLVDVMDFSPSDSTSLCVVSPEDAREEVLFIGTSQPDSEYPMPVSAGEVSPTQFFHRAFVNELSRLGVKLVQTPKQADRTICIKLERFWIDETNLYRCEIQGEVEVKSRGGTSLWRGPIGGTARRFGQTMILEHYQKSYSDATQNLLRKLLSNPSFQKAISP